MMPGVIARVSVRINSKRAERNKRNERNYVRKRVGLYWRRRRKATPLGFEDL
jgi:hypothetical protein